MKVNRNGQGAILTDEDFHLIRRRFTDPKYRLIWDIAWYTGERWGAICQLHLDDVYQPGSLKVRSHILFRAATTKQHETRTCPIHPRLAELLELYKPREQQYLFESRICRGRPITLKAADLTMRSAIALAGLTHKGYCTHSTRRTFITRLWRNGTDLYTIALITGHKDLKSLVRYIQADPSRLVNAIALL